MRGPLANSYTIPAVKALAALGPETVIGYAERFGFPKNMPPYLSLALGSAEATLVDVTGLIIYFTIALVFIRGTLL